ncbi:MAG: hypothetical protein ABR568_04700 [Pyrinomonadaceae bacterium]
MKRIQSALCASALALALSSTVLAGNIHSIGVTSNGNIHSIGVTSNGNIHSGPGSITDLLTWGDITGVITTILGNIHV